MSTADSVYCNCGIPWAGPNGGCLQCNKKLNPNRVNIEEILSVSEIDYCDCGTPEINFASNCAKCNKPVSMKRLDLLGYDLEKIRREIDKLEGKNRIPENAKISTPLHLQRDKDPFFCGNCGTRQMSSHNFCQKCGTPLDKEVRAESIAILDKPAHESVNEIKRIQESIRINLAKYQSHKQVTCLECGYEGLMGVSKIIENKRSSWPVYALATLVFMFGTFLFGPLVILVGLILGGMLGVYLGSKDNASRKFHVVCPNCLEELEI